MSTFKRKSHIEDKCVCVCVPDPCVCAEGMETKPFPGFYFSMRSFGVNIIIDSQSQGL